jgi:hypothetical protein
MLVIRISITHQDCEVKRVTGAFAPGVTVNVATYRMWVVDGGLKWKGLAINGQYFVRSLNDFDADGPLPLASTLDHGGELTAGYFVNPKRVMVYGRGSWVRGQFGDSHEYGGGVKWHFLPTERLWLNGELFQPYVQVDPRVSRRSVSAGGPSCRLWNSSISSTATTRPIITWPTSAR